MFYHLLYKLSLIIYLYLFYNLRSCPAIVLFFSSFPLVKVTDCKYFYLQNLGSDDLNYAAVTFCQKAKRRAVEPNVVYAATR